MPNPLNPPPTNSILKCEFTHSDSHDCLFRCTTSFIHPRSLAAACPLLHPPYHNHASRVGSYHHTNASNWAFTAELSHGSNDLTSPFTSLDRRLVSKPSVYDAPEETVSHSFLEQNFVVAGRRIHNIVSRRPYRTCTLFDRHSDVCPCVSRQRYSPEPTNCVSKWPAQAQQALRHGRNRTGRRLYIR